MDVVRLILFLLACVFFAIAAFAAETRAEGRTRLHFGWLGALCFAAVFLIDAIRALD